MQHATGPLYQRCVSHISTILWNHQGRRLQSQEQKARQYHPVSEETAVQMRLLLDTVAGTKRADQAERLVYAIADMHPCESSWWYACHRNRNRPRKVLEALALMYA